MLDKIAKVIAQHNNIAILPHVSADGDALGSSFALAAALTGIKKKVAVFLEEEVPFTFGFLPGKNLSVVYPGTNFMGTKEQFDAVLAVDCGDAERLGQRKELFEKASVRVNIDHHPTNTFFAELNFVDPKASATGEIVFRLLKLLDIEMNKDIATDLYTALATDTGSFRYSSTTPETHTIAAELIKSGVDVADVCERIFDSYSYEKVKLTGEAINTLELFEDGKIAIMTIPTDLIKKTGAKDEDCEGIINTARGIRGVNVAAMLRQWDNGDIKVNLRSNSQVDVSAVAKLFSGGGHKKAAGYTTGGTLDEARNKLLNELRKAL